ncbi:hypothetical protein GCM10007415_32890 [Parapedobacter pyrenivorans]|uniref:Uncharacterized protein n=1 Tax=Parapedobacter pyrenivorans TaxID=1305674 RepID=A0A917HY57_9SPHI|nr:hypothetical protein GCM10007415_32890 [Parapedobacter pyrenivorans]
MPGDEKLRGVSLDFLFYLQTVAARITANVGHPDIYGFTSEPQVFGIAIADNRSVNIAKDSFQWFECRQGISYRHIAEIASMPYFVTSVEMRKYGFIEVAMCI